MKLKSLAINKILPVWSSYKTWARDNDDFMANGYVIGPGYRAFIKRSDENLHSVVIGLTGAKADHVLMVVIKPETLRTELHAVPILEFGNKLGTRTVSLFKGKALPSTKITTLQNLYAALRTNTNWEDSVDGSLRSSDPIAFLEAYHFTHMNLPDKSRAILQSAYKRANDLYHNNGLSFLTDQEFDRLREIIGPDKTTQQVGAPVPRNGGKTELAVQMGSLEKIKTTKEVDHWLQKTGALKNGVVVMPKVDGVSLQLVYNNTKLVQAFTRGDGTEGKDITNIAMHTPAIPKSYVVHSNGLPRAGKLVLRAEAFMKVSTFEAVYKVSARNPTGFKNPRNMIAGILNRQKPDTSVLIDVQILVFDIQQGFDASKEIKLEALKQAKFPTIPFTRIMGKSELNLDSQLNAAKKRDYEIDGLVLEVNDNALAAKLGTERGGINPVFTRAYKPADGSNNAQTEVLDVEYKISKHGLVKPTIVVEPVTLSGVTVSRATAFNGAYIRDNNIGIGTVVTLTRSGDVIPYIVSVDKSTKALLPNKKKIGDWHWNETGVDIVVDDEDNEDQQIQRLVHFFSALKVENFSEGLIKRFYEHGYTTIKDIISLDVSTMVKEIGHIQATSANAIKNEIERRLIGVPMPTLMYASGCFGRNLGSTKLTSLYNQMHDDLVFGWVGNSLSDIAATIANVPGFSLDSGKQFAVGLKSFLRFLKEHKGLIKPSVYQAPKRSSSILNGKTICFTGFRDALLEDWIVANGGNVGRTPNKNTDILLMKAVGSGSLKEQKAIDLGITIMTAKQFRSKYRIG